MKTIHSLEICTCNFTCATNQQTPGYYRFAMHRVPQIRDKRHLRELGCNLYLKSIYMLPKQRNFYRYVAFAIHGRSERDHLVVTNVLDQSEWKKQGFQIIMSKVNTLWAHLKF